jgi:hypothetical protein
MPITDAGITDTQSFGLVIRDVFYDALDRDPFFDAYVKRKTRMLAVMPNLLPYLGVYIIDELQQPDGDANAGCIRFTHTLRIGFSVMIALNDQVEAERTIDRAYRRIMNVYRDQYVMNLLDTFNPHLGAGNPDNTKIESITRGLRRHVFGAASVNNETPTAELQYDVSAFWRSDWGPVIEDDLEEIAVRTGIKIGETQAEMDQRQQVGGDYVLETAAKAKPNRQKEKHHG